MEESSGQNCSPMTVGMRQSGVTLSLENLAQLRNPRLSIRVESDNCDPKSSTNFSQQQQQQNQMYKIINHQISSVDTEYDLDSSAKLEPSACRKCDSLRQMLFLRDKTIMKLAEDRDEMKIKLTKTMNMNIELTRQLMKYHTLSTEKIQNVRNESVASGIHSRNESRSKSPIMIQLKDEVADLRRKCIELDGLYQTFKHNIYSLRGVFNEFGITDKQQQHQEQQQLHHHHHIQHRHTQQQPHQQQQSNHYNETEVESSSSSNVSHNFGHDLPVEDHNNNSSPSRTHQSFQRTSSPIETLKSEHNSHHVSPKESSVHNEKLDDSVSLSNFDVWYNS